MTCEEVRISLGAYVLGALDAEETAEVEAHLETCAACRAELAELSGLPPLLARVSAEDIERAAAPPRAVLDGVFADVLAKANANADTGAGADGAVAPPVVASARRGRRSRVLLALAASVVVAAVGGTAWVSVAQKASESTAVGSVAAAPDQASRAAQGKAAPAQAAQDQAAQDQPGQADAAGTEAPPELLVAPASPAPSAASSKGAVARKVEPSRAEATVTASPVPSEARGSSGDVRIVVRLVPHDGGTQVVARVAGVPAGTVCTLRAVAKDGTVSTLGSWTVGRGEYRGQKMILEGSTALRPGQIDRIELADSGGRVLVTARL
ncbi:anti-sigma factor family protein [Microbispora catharanthi]|uniref:anti-sigma factor family protein n=1 Tax=Microbispora catharanthi TaxID=1712871 RepID=UPI001F0D5FE9|nr:zf-HC2 domain-containing protein [Microbispora catharanthi]